MKTLRRQYWRRNQDSLAVDHLSYRGSMLETLESGKETENQNPDGV